MSYINKIKTVRKNKYSFFFDGSKKFFKDYINSRNFFRKKLILLKFNKKTKITQNDKVYYKMINIYKKKTKLKLQEKDLLFLNNIYHKFEIFLILRQSYNSYFSKKTNFETNIRTYILFFHLLEELNIHKLSKLNCFLKLNDKILSDRIFDLESEYKHLIIKGIDNEIKIIMQYV